MTIHTQNDILSVSSLTHAIKLTLEPGFRSVKVKGEVTNYRLQASGHEYFSLKDEKCQISCVFFKGYRSQSSIQIRPGDQIVIEGDLTVYEPRGSYQIIVKRMKNAGVGDLLIKIHELKRELEALGWCRQECKKKLPQFPKTIGVITSPTGSVIRDIIHVLSRRYAGFQLLLNPVKVQGEGAAEDIAKAIDEMNQYNLADILIVGRGGGSLEDLMPFNERCVAKAIFNSRIPIISAVGHETDTSIADLVADMRAPTPSAAAEIAIREKQMLLDRLLSSKETLTKIMKNQIREEKRLLTQMTSLRQFNDPSYFLKEYMQQIDLQVESIQDAIQHSLIGKRHALNAFCRQKEGLNPVHKLQFYQDKCHQYTDRIDTAIQAQIKKQYVAIHSLMELIHSINPKKLLKRGYCIPFAQNSNSVIISSKQVKPKDHIRLLLHDGEIKSEVKEVK